MKNILLPTDFSDNAFNAVTYALNLYKNEACTFYLVNTYTPIIYDTEFMHSNPVMLEEDIYKTNSINGLDTLEEMLKKEYANEKHRFRKVSSFNFLADELATLADQHKPELIIMGTQGATGAEEVFIGTQTVDVIKKSKHPVLAIPSGYAFRSPKNILFPTDYELNFNDIPLEIVKNIAGMSMAGIHFLHVTDKKELTEQQQDSRKIIAKKFKNSNESFHLVEGSDVPETILEFQQNNDIDLLVMVNNKHSFFENLFFTPKVQEIGFHVKVPFLVIPSGKYAMRAIPVNLVR